MRWIEQHRSDRRRRTKKLPVEQKKVCTKATFGKVLKIKKSRAGRAKGAWINAGNDLSKAQTGTNRVVISGSHLAYARKAARSEGKGTPARSSFLPSATLTNPVPYSSDGEILSKSAIDNALKWALKNTLKWYKMAMRPKKSKL
jgi:hypothetical protein